MDPKSIRPKPVDPKLWSGRLRVKIFPHPMQSGQVRVGHKLDLAWLVDSPISGWGGYATSNQHLVVLMSLNDVVLPMWRKKIFNLFLRINCFSLGFFFSFHFDHFVFVASQALLILIFLENKHKNHDPFSIFQKIKISLGRRKKKKKTANPFSFSEKIKIFIYLKDKA